MPALLFILLSFYSIQTEEAESFEIIEYSYPLKEDDSEFYFKAKYYFYSDDDFRYYIISDDSSYRAFKIEVSLKMPPPCISGEGKNSHNESVTHSNIVRIKKKSVREETPFLPFNFRNEANRIWYEKLKATTGDEIPVTQEMLEKYNTIILEAQNIDKPLLPPPPERTSVRFINNE